MEMNTYTLKMILAAAVILALLLIFKALFSNVTKRDTKIDKRRTGQLEFGEKRTSSQDMSTAELVGKLTQPARNYILPSMEIEDTKFQKLEEQIIMSGWKGFDPLTYIALDITLKIVGVVVGGFFMTQNVYLGGIWMGILCFAMNFLFKNSQSNRRFGLLQEFPDFIRITQGFLMSGMPLAEAIENALPYVGENWYPVLEEFLVNSNLYSQNDCLELLKKQVPIFEVIEFFALLQLNLEQGIDIRECFGGQAEKVKAMQMEVMLGKINNRKMMGTMIQAPLMLCMIGGFALPTIAGMIGGGLF